ncbi:hypothetical protein LTR08_003659 [Meristemomyces frigidus]|nr:hypothetical protein LTR08_003659 [Meristemomyces frigidus]
MSSPNHGGYDLMNHRYLTAELSRRGISGHRKYGNTIANLQAALQADDQLRAHEGKEEGMQEQVLVEDGRKQSQQEEAITGMKRSADEMSGELGQPDYDDDEKRSEEVEDVQEFLVEDEPFLGYEGMGGDMLIYPHVTTAMMRIPEANRKVAKDAAPNSDRTKVSMRGKLDWDAPWSGPTGPDTVHPSRPRGGKYRVRSNGPAPTPGSDHDETPPIAQTSRLLSLKPELRKKIWSLVLKSNEREFNTHNYKKNSDGVSVRSKRTDAPIFRVCKTMREEAIAQFSTDPWDLAIHAFSAESMEKYFNNMEYVEKIRLLSTNSMRIALPLCYPHRCGLTDANHPAPIAKGSYFRYTVVDGIWSKVVGIQPQSGCMCPISVLEDDIEGDYKKLTKIIDTALAGRSQRLTLLNSSVTVRAF